VYKRQVLDTEKHQLRRLIYSRSLIREYGDKLDINYHYRQNRAQIIHTLNYCTKATFLDYDWDPALAEGLYGELYVVSWGYWKKWEQPIKWQLPRGLKSLVSLEKAKCPECGSPMNWSRRCQPFTLVLAEDPVDLGNGYYRLPPIRPPPDLSNETTQRLYRLKQAHSLALKQAQARADAMACSQTEFDNSAWADILDTTELLEEWQK